MTGHAERDASYRDAMRSGAESIQKPFNHEQLIRVVRQALDTADLQAQS
jgi:FixJ family two-component response regulator